MGGCLSKNDNIGNHILACCNADENKKIDVLSEKEQIEYYKTKRISQIYIDEESNNIIDITNKNSQKQLFPSNRYFDLMKKYSKNFFLK